MSYNDGGSVAGIQITDLASAKKAYYLKTHGGSEGPFASLNNDPVATRLFNHDTGVINTNATINSYLEFKLLSQFYPGLKSVDYGFIGAIPGRTAAELGVKLNDDVIVSPIDLSSYRGVVDANVTDAILAHAAERGRYITKGLGSGVIVEHRNVIIKIWNDAINPGTYTIPSQGFLGVDEANLTVTNNIVKVEIKVGGELSSVGYYYILSGVEAGKVLATRLTSDSSYTHADVLNFLNGALHAGSTALAPDFSLLYDPVKPSNVFNGTHDVKMYKAYELTEWNRWVKNSFFTGMIKQSNQRIINILNVRSSSFIASLIAQPLLFKLHKLTDDATFNQALAVFSSAFGSELYSYIRSSYDSCVGSTGVKNAFNAFKVLPNFANGVAFIEAIETKIGPSLLLSYQY